MPKRLSPVIYCPACESIIYRCEPACRNCGHDTGNDHTWVIQSHTKSFVEPGVITYHERCSVCHGDRLRREEE